jgi:uncharacterized protein (DUF2147 family)
MHLLIALVVWAASWQSTVHPDDVLGTWLTAGDDAAKVSIYKVGSKYYGKIIWLKIPLEEGKSRVDKNNSDAARRNDPVIGLVLVNEFTWDADDEEWNSGTVYDPKSGNTYSGYLKLVNPDKLKLRGYIGISLIGRTEYWARVR